MGKKRIVSKQYSLIGGEFRKLANREIASNRPDIRKQAIKAAHLVRDRLAEYAPSARIADYLTDSRRFKVEKRYKFGSGYNVNIAKNGRVEFTFAINPNKKKSGEDSRIAWAILVTNYGRGPIKPKRADGWLSMAVTFANEAGKRGGKPIKFESTPKSGDRDGKYVKFVKRAKGVQGTGWIESAVEDAGKELSRIL